MVCDKCGKECTDEVKFCPDCGAELRKEEGKTEAAVLEAPIEEAVAEEAVTEEAPVVEETVAAPEAVSESKERKESSFHFGALLKNKAVWAVAAVVVVLLFLVLLVKGCSGSESYIALSKNAVLQVEETDDKVLVYLINGDVIETGDDEAYYIRYSQDKSTVCYENEDDELVVVKNGKVIRTGIDDAYDVMISTYGDTLLYYTDYEEVSYYDAYYGYYDEIYVGTLNLYNINKDKNYEIAEEVVEESAVLSPNGETVAYVSDYEATDDFKGYYSIKGKTPVAVGKEKCVFAIADKAAYIYYIDDDRIYAKKKGKDEEKLASDIYEVEVMMNADHTEMLFLNDDKTYLTVKAGEKKKVSNDEFRAMLLNEKAMQEELYMDIGRTDISVTYTGTDTFKEKVFYSYGDILFLSKKYETDKLASNVYDYVLSEDGESMVYINSKHDIIKVTNFAKGGKETTLVDDAEAYYLYSGANLKYVYFLNEDEEFCYIKGKKVKKIADDVSAAAISADGTYCYYVVDGEELFYTKKAGKGKNLMTVEDGFIDAENAYGLALIRTYEDEEYTIYQMDGKKMKVFYKSEE